MEVLIKIFGEGKDLTCLQMSCRGVAIFIISLVLIRLSGRRSFGIRTPLDNIILILLGGILSRAVTGASPFLPIIVTSTLLVLLHRLLGHLITRSRLAGSLIEGEKITLFQNGEFIKENMDKALVCIEDVLQGIRKAALTDRMGEIDTVYMERNGEISVIKKIKE